MRFKSENGFSSLCVLSAAWIAGALSTPALAQVTAPTGVVVHTTFLHPPAPYTWIRETGAVHLARLDSTSHGINTEAPSLDPNRNYRSWEITTTSAAAGGDLSEMIYFDVQVTDAVTAGANNRLVLTVESEIRSGSPVHAFVPIYTVGETPCLSNASCLYEYRAPSVDQVTGAVTSGVAFAADFGNAPKSIRVGFFLADICAYLGVSGVQPMGCLESAPSSVIVPNGSTTAQFTLHFRVRQVPLTFPAPATKSISAVLKEGSVSKELKAVVTVQAAGPSVACTTAESYFPGDTQILVDTTKIVGTAQSGGAPIKNIVVTAKKLPDSPSQTIPPAKDDDVVGYIAPSGSNPVGGFENTTDGTDNQYVVQYNVMDEAGVMPLPDSGCILGSSGQGVQTSAIQSFLGSSACFIATASFRSEHHPVVEELRAFRDRVLARSRIGREFIRFYYDLSPRAAAVVDAHPALRLPALFILAPVEFLAALLLRPWLALIWILGWGGLGVFLYHGRRKTSA